MISLLTEFLNKAGIGLILSVEVGNEFSDIFGVISRSLSKLYCSNKRLISKSQHQNQIDFKHILNLCYIETIKYVPNFLDLINLGKI